MPQAEQVCYQYKTFGQTRLVLQARSMQQETVSKKFFPTYNLIHFVKLKLDCRKQRGQA